MKNIKAVLFDLDGTLLDTLEDLYLADLEAMRHFGYPEHTMDDVRRFVGNGLRKLTERSLPEGKDDPGLEEVFRYLASYYRAHAADHAVPYDGILNLMEKLKNDGIRMAVLSNKPDEDTKRLCEKFFRGYTEINRGAIEGIALKPAAHPVHELLKDMGLRPEEAIYAGDSEVDIMTAKNAGLRCVSVTWGFRSAQALRDAGATVLVNTPDEFYTWIHNEEEYHEN